MTNEEAIKILKSKMDGHTDTSYEWVETVRMAIKALEQTDTLDRIITRIEQTRDKDKLCEYPYNRCIRILKEEFENDKSNIKI